MPMHKHHEAPGSPEWHARRANCYNASDAPAMLGCHPTKTRTALLAQLHTGIDPEFSDYVQKRVIDPGHRIEELARPIAEEILGDDLQVLAGSLIVEGISRPLGASFDGITFMDDIHWECKSMNDELRAALPHSGRDSHESNSGRNLPKDKRVQLEQQLMLSNNPIALFTAAKFDGDGKVIEERHCRYESDPALRAEILAGWKQFDADLAAYVPTEVKERPNPEVTVALPALFIQAKGEITTSNMKEYGEALTARLAQIRSIQLVTDQDFSNAKESAKLLRDNIAAAKQAKEAMLAQTATVGETARLIDSMCEDMRLTALQLEKDVDREDLAKKAAMIATAKSAYNKHIEGLIADTGGPWSVLQAPDWASSIKGKRNFASMQDALDTALAQGKIAADESARKIRAALAALAEASKGYEHLFSDRLSFISQTAENVRMLAGARITQHKAAEQKRADELAEQARETIRKEEQAKAEKAARDKLAAELAEAQRLADEQARQATPPAAPAPEPVRVPVASAPVSAPAANVVPISRPAAPADTGARVKLGDIAASIAPLSITANGLASLGFPHVGTDKAAKLYRTADLPRIYAAMVAHIEAAQAKQAA